MHAARNRLPESRAVGALDQQDLERLRMNDHQHGDRNLVGHRGDVALWDQDRKLQTTADLPVKITQKGLPSLRQYSAAP